MLEEIRFGKTMCIRKMLFLFYISTKYVASLPIRWKLDFVHDIEIQYSSMKYMGLIVHMFGARGLIFIITRIAPHGFLL